MNVRIHSFGYGADEGSTKADVSNIADFASGLLNVLKCDETMSGSDDVRMCRTQICIFDDTLLEQALLADPSGGGRQHENIRFTAVPGAPLLDNYMD